MKNPKRLSFVFALAASLLLAGCGDLSASSSVSSSKTATFTDSSSLPVSSSTSSSSLSSSSDSSFSSDSSSVATTITIADTIDASSKQMVVGSKIDLASFVSVTPNDAEWSVSTSGDKVTVDGKTFTAVKAGPYEVTITCGSAKASVSGTVISQDLEDITDVLSEDWGGTNYTAELFQGDALLASAQHNDAFVMQDYNGAQQGFLVHYGSDENDSTAYHFTMNDGEISVSAGKYDDALGFNAFTSAFPATSTDYHDEMVSGEPTGNVIIDDRPVMIPAIGDYTMGFSLSSLGADKLVVSRSEGEEEGTSILTYSLFKGTTDLGYKIVCSKFEETANPTIWAYVMGDDVPTPYNQSELNSFFAKMGEKKSYALNVKADWVDGNGVALNAAIQTNLADKCGLPEGTFKAYVNATTSYSIDETNGKISSFLTHADSNGNAAIYEVAYDGKKWSATNRTTAAGGTDVWTASGLSGKTSRAFTEDALGNLDIMSRKESADQKITLTSIYYLGSEGIIFDFLDQIPFYGDGAIAKWDGHQNCFGAFSFVIDPIAQTVEVKCKVTYNESNGGQYWVYDLIYSDVGIDAVPTEYLANVPSWPAE